MQSRLWHLALVLTLAPVLLGWIVTNAGAVVVSEFSLPAGGEPLYLATGSDGNLWITDRGTRSIDRVNTQGEVTGQFTFGLVEGLPWQIVSGPDGALWFVEPHYIGRITTEGAISETALPGEAEGIASGPLGSLWVAEHHPAIDGTGEEGSIDQVLPGKTEIPAYTVPGEPKRLVAGPDGNLWFTNSTTEEIGMMAPYGEVKEFGPGLPSSSCSAVVYEGRPCPGIDAIAVGSDGRLWYSEYEGKAIGAITTSGQRTEYTAGLSDPSEINSFALGPEGNLWFTEAQGRVGWITPTGNITEIPLNSLSVSEPWDITLGADQNLWATERLGNRIVRIIPNVPPVIVTGGASAVTTDSAALAGTVRSRGSETTYSFQYGTTTGYGSSTAQTSNGSGDNTQGVTAQIGGLTPGTTYHYRIVASNANGQSYGADGTFTTAPAPPPPPPRVTVGPFQMYFAGDRSGRGHLRLTRIVVLEVAPGDRVSYACKRCEGFSTRATQTAHGSRVTFRTRALVVSARALLQIAVTGPDGSRRVRTYGFLIGQAESKLKSQECFLPNDHVAVTCPGSLPAKPKPKPSSKYRKPSAKHRKAHH